MGKNGSKALRQTEIPLSSLSKGLRLLLKLRELSQPVGLSEASRLMGFNKATTFRILLTLERYGFVERDDKHKNYKIGVNAFHVGSGYLNGTKRAKYREVMKKVASNRGHAVTMAVLDGTSVLFIERVDSVGRLRVAVEVGERVPAYASSSGKVLLARYGDEEIRKKFRYERLTPLTKNTLTSVGRLLTDLAVVRTRGYATNNEESIKGLFGLAVPIRDQGGFCVAALSGSYIVGTMSKKEQNELLERLFTGAAEIEKIGFDDYERMQRFARYIVERV